MRYLLSSIAFMLFVSCVSYPKKNGFSQVTRSQNSIKNPYFSNVTQDYVYKATIDAFGNSFGGIFIVKKLEENQHRIVFTTELGNKIFDFTFEEETFKVNQILKELDKKILLNVLRNDFRVLITEHPSAEKVFQKKSNFIYKTSIGKKKYFHFLSEEKLTQVVQMNNSKEKVAFIFSEINDNIAEHIQILHKNFNLKITLKSL